MNADPTFHTFLSYNSLDHALVEQVAEELHIRKCKCFVDRWYLQPGRDWVNALERALSSSGSVTMFIGPHEMGRWQQRERAWALDRLAGATDFPVIPVLLPGCEPPLGFMKQLMWIDLREDPADAAQMDFLAAAIRGEVVDRAGQTQKQAMICPYRGLLAFREEDADFFFGRETYTNELEALVGDHPFVAVTGASGSGKSSVVRAGLVPRLRRCRDGAVWDILTMLPRENPLHSLADVLLPVVEPDLSGIDLIRKRKALAEDLENSRVPLWDLVAEGLRQQRGTDRLLLVVDQWEELYTNCKNDNQRNRFIDELLEATSRKNSPLSVVLTVRWDFYGEILKNRPLLDCVARSQLHLGPMKRDELHSVIEGPGNKVGLTFQDGLVERILDDAGDEPGRLSLLEFMLEELWKCRRGDGQLTHDAYKKLGRLTGAIATQAEAVFSQLNSEEQVAVESLFRRLVRAGSKTEEDTRRRADLQSLDTISTRVARKLADNRLLVTTRAQTVTESDAASGEDAPRTPETVEVAHEELIRRWDRLKLWVNKDREFLQWRSRLIPLLGAFEQDPKAALLRGLALKESLAYFPSRAPELEENERTFVLASQKAERRRKQIMCGVVVVVLCIVLGLGYWDRQEKRRQRSLNFVKDLLNPAASIVEPNLRNLDEFRDLAVDQLELVLEDNDRVWIHHVHAAYGLIRFDAAGANEVALLLDTLPKLPPDEGPNLINALSRLIQKDDPLNVQRTIEERITAAVDDAVTRNRLLTVAAQIGMTRPLSQACMLRENPWQRTAFIHGFADFPGDLDEVADLLDQSDLASETRSALCLAVGRLGDDGRQVTQNVLKQVYLTAAEGGTHSAARWALLQQGISEDELQHFIYGRPPTEATPDWEHFQAVAGLTMIKVPSREFALGSVTDGVGGGEDSGWTGDPTLDDKAETFPSIWMSDREITVGQFEAVLPQFTVTLQKNVAKVPLRRQLPIRFVSWYDAVEFCNRLSTMQGIEPFYAFINPELVERDTEGHIQNAEIGVNKDGQHGYRLPTEKEWEYACRCISTQGYCFGESTEHLGDYAVTGLSSPDLCGKKLPNAWGLFDMHGNLREWCWDLFHLPGATNWSRVLRGGSFNYIPQYLRSALRFHYSPDVRFNYIGFRISRTP